MWKTYFLEWCRAGGATGNQRVWISPHISKTSFRGRNRKEAEDKAARFIADAQINITWRLVI